MMKLPHDWGTDRCGEINVSKNKTDEPRREKTGLRGF